MCVAKSDPEKVAAQVEGMQQELKNLQLALGELVDALITEAKPDFAEIKKLQSLKKKALSEGETEALREASELAKPKKVKSKRRKSSKTGKQEEVSLDK
jgi:hypothetical protein